MSHLSSRPQTISEDCWYYEDLSHITVYHRASTLSGISAMRIPWRKLEASYKRRKLYQADRAKKKAKKGRQT